MKKAVLLSLCATFAFGLSFNSASAIPPFNNEFKAVYIKENPSTDAERSLAEAVELVKCNVCHFGKNKKDRNAYGDALDALLDKKEDAKNVDKIRQALETVAKQSAPAGGTFGDRIKAGKLPVDEQ